MKRDEITVKDGLPFKDEVTGLEVRKPNAKFNTYNYNGLTELDQNGNEVEKQPQFLTNPNYYFLKSDPNHTDVDPERAEAKRIAYEALLDEMSDTEQASRKEEHKQAKVATIKTFRGLMALEHQMDLMNGILDKVKIDISQNSGKAIDFIENITEERGTEVK